MAQRPKVPERIKRQVLKETGYVCAVPGCGAETTEVAHIVAYSECRKLEFDNLIALCPNHHTRYDKGEIHRQSVVEWKAEMRLRTAPDPALKQEQEERWQADQALAMQISQLKTENNELREKLAQLEARLPQATQTEKRVILDELKESRRALQLFNAGVRAFAREEWLEALRCFQESAQIEPAAGTLNNLGVTYCQFAQYDRALDIFNRAEEGLLAHGLPRDPHLMGNRAYVLHSRRQYHDALKGFLEAERERVAQNRPMEPEVFKAFGNIYDRLGRYDDALTAYADAEKLKAELGLPPDPALANNRGNVYDALGKYEEALAAYDEASRIRKRLGLSVDSPNLPKNRGVVYMGLGRYNDALEAIDKAERLRKLGGLPEDPDLHGNRGGTYCCLGRYEEALDAFDKATQIEREQGLLPDPRIIKNRGTVYFYMDRCTDALALYEEAERMRSEQRLPPDPEISLNRSLIHQIRGNTDLACQYAQQARERYKELIHQGGVEHPRVQQLIDEVCFAT
jgi:tetratricopeptide (TPR) repeat protein